MEELGHQFWNGLDAHRRGDLATARACYEAIQANDPLYRDAQFNLAVLESSAGRVDAAEAAYRRLLAQDPDDPDVLINLGNLILLRGDEPQAEALYLQALTQNETAVAALANLGSLYLNQENHVQAQNYLNQALILEPGHVDANVSFAVLLHRLGRTGEGISHLKNALTVTGAVLDIYRNLALLYLAEENVQDAVRTAAEGAAAIPENAEMWYFYGLVLVRNEDLLASAAAFEKAIAYNPNFAEAWQEYGNANSDLEQINVALSAYETADSLSPNNPDILYHWGNALMKDRQLDQARRRHEQALALAGERPEYMVGYANCLHEQKEHEKALEILTKGLTLRPDMAEGWNSRGNCLASLGRRDEAIAAYHKAIDTKPNFAVAIYNLGHTYAARYDFDTATRFYEQALSVNPELANAHNGIGLIYQSKNQHEEAIAAFDRALEINERFHDAVNNKAVSLQSLGRFNQAVDYYYRLIDLDSDNPAAYFNLGTMMQLLERWDESVVALQNAVSRDPQFAIAYSYLLHALLQQCSWRNLTATLDRVRELTQAKLDAGEKSPLTPFALQSLPGPFSMAFRQQVAESACREAERSVASLKAQLNISDPPRQQKDKLTIGYVSPDFRFHSVAISFQGILANHDRDCFRFNAYSLHRGKNDELKEYFRATFDSFTDVMDMELSEIAEKIAADGVDILVDLAGHTRGSCMEIFALRPAPIQVHYLGYSATIGANFIDYLVTDHQQVPAEQRQYFTENLVYLPDVFMAGRRVEIPEEVPSRSELNLPENGIVFANFNHRYKFDPATFTLWMRLLKQIPNSVFWCLKTTDQAVANLRREAEQRGVDPDRLVFASVVPHPQHLARLQHADLALDNTYHGGGITTLDALWSGVPVLTVKGDTPQARNGASLLHAIDMTELVLPDSLSLEQKALHLANNPDELAALKQRLRHDRHHKPLFDMARLTRHLETGYRMMWERYAAGLEPAMLEVPALRRNQETDDIA